MRDKQFCRESKLSGYFLSVIEIGRDEEGEMTKENRQETKMRMIENPRTKTVTLGENNVTNKVKLKEVPGSCSLKSLDIIVRRRKKERRVIFERC
ncbi:hypothetical protein ALC53_13767 [Atta colombica]|uniref:Uncharacterized protein n=1 Tax=Atta colombica TaxID=520822 RepID=A0A195AUQ1_9HYME|nr:hypothetical protein ALC53_13767 [Atta colombica]